MHKYQYTATRVMKYKSIIILPKERNKVPVINFKEIQISKLPDKSQY